MLLFPTDHKDFQDQLQKLGSKQKVRIHQVCHPCRDLSIVLEKRLKQFFIFSLTLSALHIITPIFGRDGVSLSK